ncbi:hypothetical protein GJAV_G00060670 [Gymnothorax javanicus]|nr:hypothetical protein GJAV_G00060670 [Gymnothorax javanicus]
MVPQDDSDDDMLHIRQRQSHMQRPRNASIRSTLTEDFELPCDEGEDTATSEENEMECSDVESSSDEEWRSDSSR